MKISFIKTEDRPNKTPPINKKTEARQESRKYDIKSMPQIIKTAAIVKLPLNLLPKATVLKIRVAIVLINPKTGATSEASEIFKDSKSNSKAKVKLRPAIKDKLRTAADGINTRPKGTSRMTTADSPPT